MSLNIKDNYATVFDPEVHEKYVSANLSTGRKSKDVDDTGRTKYINSYWNAIFVGKAFEKAKNLNNKDRIHIMSASFTHEKSTKTDDSGRYRYYYNLTIFEFENMTNHDDDSDNDSNDDSDNDSNDDYESEEDLPF